jgi:hypothetical protein
MSLKDELEDILENLDEDSLIPVSDIRDSFNNEGLHFAEIVDLQSYLITQPHLVNDVPWKLNHKANKLCKRMDKGKHYDNDK